MPRRPGPRHLRRERRRQVDADEGARRHPCAGRRRDPHRRPAGAVRPPFGRAAGRHRHHPPGAGAVAAPHGGAEHLPGPRALALGRDRPQGDERRGRGGVAPRGLPHRSAHRMRPALGGRAADGGDRQGGVARRAHPGARRAHGRAGRRGIAEALRPDRRAAPRGRGHALHLAPHGRGDGAGGRHLRHQGRPRPRSSASCG